MIPFKIISMNDSDLANLSAVEVARASIFKVEEANAFSLSPNSIKACLVLSNEADKADNDAVVVAEADKIEKAVDEARLLKSFDRLSIDLPKQSLPLKQMSPANERFPFSSIVNASAPF